MSQSPYQDPGQYDPNLPYATPALPQRPAAITGIAIAGIVLGSMGVLCSCFGIFSNGLMLRNGGHNPLMPTIEMDPIIVKIGVVQSVLGVAFCAVMLIACILALKLRPIARTLMIVWSFATILYAILVTIAQIEWVVPANSAMMAKMQPANPLATSGFMTSLGVPMAIMGGIFYCVLPVLILILWNRADVKAAFAGTKTPPLQRPGM